MHRIRGLALVGAQWVGGPPPAHVIRSLQRDCVREWLFFLLPIFPFCMYIRTHTRGGERLPSPCLSLPYMHSQKLNPSVAPQPLSQFSQGQKLAIFRPAFSVPFLSFFSFFFFLVLSPDLVLPPPPSALASCPIGLDARLG